MRNATPFFALQLLLLPLLLFLSPAAPAAGAEQTSQLVDFELDDQFGTTYRREDYFDRIVLVIGSDADGSEYNAAWGQAIDDALSEHPDYGRIAVLPLADLRGVPFFLRGMVRGMMPESEDERVLMDWKGRIAKTYEFVRGESNVLVFTGDGLLALHTSGPEPDASALAPVLDTLRSQLEAAR